MESCLKIVRSDKRNRILKEIVVFWLCVGFCVYFACLFCLFIYFGFDCVWVLLVCFYLAFPFPIFLCFWLEPFPVQAVFCLNFFSNYLHKTHSSYLVYHWRQKEKTKRLKLIRTEKKYSFPFISCRNTNYHSEHWAGISV